MPHVTKWLKSDKKECILQILNERLPSRPTFYPHYNLYRIPHVHYVEIKFVKVRKKFKIYIYQRPYSHNIYNI